MSPFQPTVGAGFLEVHAHDDQQVVGELARGGGEVAGVVEGRGGVVDGARSGDHEQPVVRPVEDADDGLPALSHGVGRGGAERQFMVQQGGCDQGNHAVDALVVEI